MKKTWSIILAMLLIPIPLQAQTEMHPERVYLQNAAEDQFASLREAARASFSGILLYPEDIQLALLEVSQYPELVVLMNEKTLFEEDAYQNKVKEYPEETQKAVEDLSEYVEIVRIMNQHIVVTSVLGELIKKDKEAIVSVVTRLGNKMHEENEEAARAWTNRLDEDPKTLEELKKAAETHAAENGLPNPNTPVTQEQMGDTTNIYNNYGYYVNPQGQTVVNGMPSQDFMSYMMLYQTTYMLLFSSMAWHSHHYHDGYYWWAYDDYWEDYYEDRWNEYNDMENSINDLNQNIDEIQQGIEDRRDDLEERKDEWKDKREDSDLSERREERQQKREDTTLAERKEQAKERLGSEESVQRREQAKEKWNTGENVQRREDAKAKWNSPDVQQRRQEMKSDFTSSDKFNNWQQNNSRYSKGDLSNWKSSYDRSFSQRGGTGFGERSGRTSYSSPNRSQQINRAKQRHSGSWGSRNSSRSRSGGGGGSRNVSRGSGGGGGSRNVSRGGGGGGGSRGGSRGGGGGGSRRR